MPNSQFQQENKANSAYAHLSRELSKDRSSVLTEYAGKGGELHKLLATLLCAADNLLKPKGNGLSVLASWLSRSKRGILLSLNYHKIQFPFGKLTREICGFPTRA